MVEKIKFPCPSCAKTLSVSTVHCGKRAKCPGCGQTVQVPGLSELPKNSAPQTMDTSSLSQPFSSSTIPKTPAASQPSSAAPVSTTLPGYVNPFGETLSNDLQLATFTSGTPANNSRSKGGTTSAHDNTVPTTDNGIFPSAVQPTPINPWAAQTELEQPNYSPQSEADKATKPSIGKSIAGLAAAVGVSLIAVVAWLVVLVVTQYEVGILAWAIGGLIGLVAGVIARNPSPIYCSLVAFVAVTAILSAKTLMAVGLMIAHFGVTAMENLAFFLPSDKFMHAYVDQRIADGQIDQTQMQFAMYYNQDYFEAGADFVELESDEADSVDEPADVPGFISFQREVRQKCQSASDAEKMQWLASAHQRHPNWIEEPQYRTAAIISLLSEEGKLSGEMQTHAKYELQAYRFTDSDENIGEDYVDNVTPNDLARRSQELNALCANFINSKSPAELDQLLIAGLKDYPRFEPFEEAFVATLDKMIQEQTLEPKLESHARAYLQSELSNGFQYYEMMSKPDFQQLDLEMRIAVNARLSELDQAARQALVDTLKQQHPAWGASETVELPDNEELKKELGDGSFTGSFAKVFSLFDILWLFLGATTAFSTALKKGQK